MENSPKTMLPVEILEQILQNVDWTGVKTCSLVSRTFCVLARPMLFQKVTLSLEPDPKLIDTRRSETAQLFEFLLEDAYVASFIREFSLDEKRSSRADDTASDWQSTADNLIVLLPKLTRLNHLSIQSSFFSDWTMKNDDLRTTIVQLCLLPRLQSLQLSFIRLRQRELQLLTSIPKLTLFCIAIPSDPPMTLAEDRPPSSSSLSPFPSRHLQDLSITARYSDHRPSAISSLMKTAGSNLTSLRIYSSPFDDRLLSSLDDIDLRRHPALLSLAICVPLTSNGCITKMASIFSPLSSSSKLKCIEICCDVDDYSFPSQGVVNTWNWANLDAILSSNTYEKLERLEITVKKVIRSRNTWQRKYKGLEEMVVELFRSHLPVVSKMVLVVAGPSVEEDG